MEPMKPTIGRIVIYKLNPDRSSDMFANNGARECPAIVVRVFEDTGKINVKLFTDGDGDPPWRTSIEEGSAPGTWHWPPRV